MRLAHLGLLLLLFANGVKAEPTLVYDGGGKLTGAINVDILGESYNVTFVDGSCAQFYDECDEGFDFFFTSEGVANEASRALAQQVFPGVTPTSIQGCDDSNNNQSCQVYTPWNTNVTVSIAAVFAPDDARFIGNAPIGANTDSGDSNSLTFAIWTWTVAPPPRCSDGKDNDNDGSVDYPVDPGCSSAADDNEADAVLIFNNEGQVIGATNVPVLGQELSVEFKDGSCSELFDDCDESSDFFFGGEGAANEASKALAIHVLPALKPKMVEGCGPGAVGTCSIYTPWNINVTVSQARLVTPDDARFVGNSTIPGSADLRSSNLATFAIWKITEPTPRCDVQLNQSSFIDGDTVTADVFRLANLSAELTPVEWKVWIGIPGLPPISLVNAGANGDLVLQPGTDFDFGALPLLPVSMVLPRGNYEIGCRILDPITGAPIWEDLNDFEVQ